MARDGTIGFWDGSADRQPKQEGRDSWAAMKAMATGPRRNLMDQAIGALFSVSAPEPGSGAGEGSVAIQGNPLVRLTKPSNAFLADKQLPHLRGYADLRADRLSEIIMQTGDIQSFFALVGYMSPEATKWTLALSQAMLRLCSMLEMPLKHGFDVARPISMSTKVQPLIQTPGHGAWPSGHATEAFALATLLTRLFHDRAFDPVEEIRSGAPLYRHAERIAMNRTVAGVHFPTDSMAGAVLGVTVAEAFVKLLDGAAQAPSRHFKGAAYAGDFTLATLTASLADPAVIETGSAGLSGEALPAWLTRMWREAVEEW
ncbi:phosphatase PAP2 family protein [Ponticoccus alexandrii]|uniref:Phosphatase PAP2 family protein n=1 Tax=Ponticoccus alexandrii TaxID=1943633 RepID=A0ABX7FCS2_9RHOB|nr:phosphoesterase [Rhodobacteraceae bacterium PD-2]QRF68373.1 phosphatase PAP2 family protein [Ponticoccus alexandrii]